MRKRIRASSTVGLFIGISMWLCWKITWDQTTCQQSNVVQQGSCSVDLLNKDHFVYDLSEHEGMKSIRPKSGRHLHIYRVEDVVTCLDRLASDDDIFPTLHFVFVGDSRIRQQFFNFLKLIPDYDQDRELSGEAANAVDLEMDLHVDRNVTSRLLNMQMSYLWLPFLDGKLLDHLEQWITHPPNLLMLGAGLHYLGRKKGADHLLFREHLIKLVPNLRELAKRTKVIWLNQFPTANNDIPRGELLSEQLERYNDMARYILKDTGVVIWDSANPFAEEYVRSCRLFGDRRQVFYMYRNNYFSCNDSTHTGYAALSYATQILFNELCRGHRDSDCL